MTVPRVVLPQLRLDELLEELQLRLTDVRSARDRIHALLEAVLAVGSDLDLQTVLRRITQARAAGLVTKSNLILGMGEERSEISQALRDLHAAGCELITITQYLRPTPRHHPVERWVKPEEFVELQEEAEQIGFAGVMSGPLVRSSYRAGRLYQQALAARG